MRLCVLTFRRLMVHSCELRESLHSLRLLLSHLECHSCCACLLLQLRLQFLLGSLVRHLLQLS